MPQACEGTPSPKADFLHKVEWVGLQFVAENVIQMLSDGGLGWLIASYAPGLVNVDDLCASNPQVPVAFTDADFLTKVGDVLQSAFPGAPFMSKLWEWAQYGAFQNFCECSPSPDPPPFTPTNPPSNFQQYGCIPHGFTWDTPSLNANCLYGCNYVVNLQGLWSLNGPGRVFVWDRHDQPTGWTLGSCFPTDGFIHEITSEGTWTHDTVDGWWTFSPGQHGPYAANFQSCPVNGQTNNATFEIMVSLPNDVVGSPSNPWGFAATAAVLCAPPPPTPTPPPSTTFDPQPPRACDATTLCNIEWSIVSWLTNNYMITQNNNSQVTNITAGVTTVTAAPTQLVPAAQHQVQGEGELATAPGTRGVAVSFDQLPPDLVSRPTDPSYFYDVGWLITGDQVGWDVKTWLHTDGQRVLPRAPAISRVGYNLADGVIITVTELVDASSSSP